VFHLLVIANNVPSSLIILTLMMEAIPYSKMSVLTGTTGLHIQEDGILHINRREYIKSYIRMS
jgi:hypothetical protein